MSEILEMTSERFLSRWIEEELNLEVISVERQKRWRAGWYVEVRTPAGALRTLFVRGDREATTITNRFDMEYNILCTLEAEGILVPHIYGMCPNPKAIVMDQAAGRPDLSTTDSDEERAAVLDQYMEELAKIHAIDPARFDPIELPRPRAAGDNVPAQFENYEKAFRKAKRRPEPILEYLIGWVRRNAPKGERPVSFLVCDPAQFMFDGDKLTAVLDLEMAYMGDRTHDLAAIQLRDTSEPLGDIGRALRHYEAYTGTKIDAAAFDYYAIAWCAVTPISMTESITEGRPTGNVLQYLEWWTAFCRIPLELIMASTGRALPAVAPIVGERAPSAPMAESLVGAIKALPAEDGFASYERGATAKLAEYMARVADYGPGIMRQDIADIEALLGRKFAGWQAADEALEAFVAQAGAEHDDKLLPLLYKRAERQCQLFRPFLSRESVSISLKTFKELIAE